MRIRILHNTIYRYDRPVSGVIQTLRLTPRNHDGQYITTWRVDISADCPLSCQIDAFGNKTHTFTADGPLEELIVHVEGVAEVEDTDGVVKGRSSVFRHRCFCARQVSPKQTTLSAVLRPVSRTAMAACRYSTTC